MQIFYLCVIFEIINIMLIYKSFINSETGEVTKTLPHLDCVEEVELKNYNKMDYRRKARRDLRSLLFLEHRYNPVRGWLITLTYDPQCLPPDDDAVLKRNIQLFMKRLRSFHQRKLHIENPRIKYVAVVEHGEEKNRLHHHLLVWNISPIAVAYMCRSNSFARNIWNNGFVNARPIDGKGINYLLKYVFKQQCNKIYKVLRSRNIGFYRIQIRNLIVCSAKDGMFRCGKFSHRIPLYVMRKVFYKEKPKDAEMYNSVLYRYHQKYIRYDPRDLNLDAIAIKGNVFRIIPRGLYNQFKHQLECNNYDIRIK